MIKMGKHSEGESEFDEHTFFKLGKRYFNHMFGDEGSLKVGGHRKGRSSKKDKAKSKSERIWDW